MKFAVVLVLCMAAVAQAQFNNRGSAFARFNSPYRQQQQYRPSQFQVVTQAPFVAQAAPAQYYSNYNADARNAQTLRYGNEIYPDGSYNYFYETENGIAAQAQGTPKNFGGNPPVIPDVAQGSFSWTSPEGKVISISYIADENGYQPQGDAIPQPPPIPPQIARALEYIARNSRQ